MPGEAREVERGLPGRVPAGSTDTDGNVAIAPNGTGTITVPAGYETRTGFGNNSLVNKLYVDEVAQGLSAVHYCVTNMPGAVGRTSTFALCNATLPWALRMANLGVKRAAKAYAEISTAVNIHEGRVTNEAVARTFQLDHSPLDTE
ncbi:MAG: hypothetical protein R6U98_05890 [Pirellulaceae bacterium]